MALLAAAQGRWVAMFVWLAVALFIDGVDGTLARRFRVAEILPRWSGDALDLVVDFTTYVFVPAFASRPADCFRHWLRYRSRSRSSSPARSILPTKR